jgi:DNA topoisomerase-2
MAEKKKIVLKKRTTDNDTVSNYSYLNGKTVEDTYQNVELRDHIYKSPDTYAGSMEAKEDYCYVYDGTEEVMRHEKLNFREAFYKCYDEIIVNALDQRERIRVNADATLKQVTKISVSLNPETGYISVENNGEGLDVVKHSGQGLYVPHVVFGVLLTSVNYDDEQVRLWGGKNGYGAKIVNIFSKVFTIETVDSHRKLHYTQTFRENMTIAEDPVIKAWTKAPYTRITYLPDYARFGIKDHRVIDEWKLLTRRVYDIAGYTDPDVSIFLNEKKIQMKSFEDYMNRFIGPKSEAKRVYQDINDRWSVGVALSTDGEFHQVSFVNGIFTDHGGRHIGHIVDNLTKRLIAYYAEKSKKNKAADLKPEFIKKNLFVFVKCKIVNPSFDTQTKRELNTLVTKFGSRADLSDDFIEKVAKLGILEMAQRLSEFREKESLSKQMNTSARAGKISHPKLCDASASAKEREKCTIVFTEGDSAASFMASGMKGIPEKQHQYWGYFPLRGKILNVRNATVKQLATNEEIKMIMKIVGLKEKVDYSLPGAPPLRYGKIMVLADADDDGHHIKALLMNFIYHYWPSLAKKEGFICDMATPICKAIKRDARDKIIKAQEFYNLSEAKTWATANPAGGWTIKYYKGLGTYNPQEAKELCKSMQMTNYFFDETSHEKFILAFAKKEEDARKDWLNNGIEPQPYSLANSKTVSYGDFIDNRLKLFSMSDNIRSIPSMIDGQKPSQRKVLFAAFKRKLKKELKVSQFAGYIAEHTSYHHGEASMYETIISMARDYVGVNNINLFTPSGQFGSRLGGGPKLKKGDNSSAARYLCTNLGFMTRMLFNEDDHTLLTYKVDDGLSIEPEWYIPVLPMLLVNGGMGIGTGYSSFCPSYNPDDIIANIRRNLKGEPMVPMVPWYRGYNGTVRHLEGHRYITVGDYIRKGTDTIRIRELPVGAKNCKSFTAYKEFLGQIIDENNQRAKQAKKDQAAAAAVEDDQGDDEDDLSVLVDLIDSYNVVKETDTDFIVDIKFKPGKLEQELANNIDYKFEKQMKLAFLFSTSNIHAYDDKGIIQKYDSPEEIITEFSKVRLDFYAKRKGHLLADYQLRHGKASARFKFVTSIIDGSLDIYRKSRAVVEDLLATQGYPRFGGSTSSEEVDENNTGGSYQYLMSMQISSFTEETLKDLQKQIEDLTACITVLTNKMPEDLWLDELKMIQAEYKTMLENWLKDNTITMYVKN